MLPVEREEKLKKRMHKKKEDAGDTAESEEDSSGMDIGSEGKGCLEDHGDEIDNLNVIQITRLLGQVMKNYNVQTKELKEESRRLKEQERLEWTKGLSKIKNLIENNKKKREEHERKWAEVGGKRGNETKMKEREREYGIGWRRKG